MNHRALSWITVLFVCTLGCVWVGGRAVHAEEAAPPPVAEASADTTGTISVHASVAGAVVWIDNVRAGETPLEQFVAVGPHVVRVAADGFDPFVRKVKVKKGGVISLAARLKPGKGTVEVQVEPGGARLILNETEEWPTPVRLRDLSPGNYKFRIEAAGHESIEGEFSFVRGKNLLIIETLVSSAGLLEVASQPVGADVWLDGEPVGQTPLKLDGLALTAHLIQLELGGYATVFRSIDSSAGNKVQVDARLPKRGAALAIRTGSPNARLLMEGVEVGSGKKVRFSSMERGRYSVQVVIPDREPIVGQVKVPVSGRVAYRAVGQNKSGRSNNGRLVLSKPLFQRWTFWTAVGVGAGGGAVGSYFAWRSSLPDAIPDGDVVVSLP